MTLLIIIPTTILVMIVPFSLEHINYIHGGKLSNTLFLECTFIARYVFGLFLCAHVKWSFFLVVQVGMELGVIFAHVVFTWCPINKEVFLFASIPNPIKTHVYGFGSALFDSFIDDA